MVSSDTQHEPGTIEAKIVAIEDRAEDVRVLALHPQAHFHWRAGQYALIHSDGFEPRPFSMAAAPSMDGNMCFHIRDTGGGLSRHLAKSVKCGDRVFIQGPFGEMIADHATARPVLMVAGGTGIAPMLALAYDIARRGLTEEGLTLIYGTRDAQTLYCARELDQLRATGELTLHLASGHITPDRLIQDLAPDLANHAIYISGPHAMMPPVYATLRAQGANPAFIYTDIEIPEPA
ncbi:MAG: hypothetical protein H6865_04670 [Rhodospirillales bacterium]|nr:hypothetical protein [Alphaproteobacteria bacterium]MCB9986911.1 hypothetical protein [Rhodospirillales bacterium]USO08312.1 MAG: hypothetical protein H6866_03620 [Rhodospirillales bacterium]